MEKGVLDSFFFCNPCSCICICRHFRHVPLSVPLFSQPIGTFRIGSWVSGIAEPGGPPLQVLRWDESLSRALALLSEARSSRDITALARDCAYSRPQLNDLTISQTLQIGAGPGPLHGNRYLKCLRSDSLRHKVEPFALPGVRRLICIEAGSGQVEGIITLRDVFQFLL
uniref:CBS domain-containing protein n=1 Tax=Physcomitrium patens TaxID=3218 RepID=A0A2K1KAF1_PHYPA|nr:hypothetical protein PHYPA_009943 [Physcomitrium patens]